MVHDKVGLPPPYFRGSGVETVDIGRFSVCWERSWRKKSPAAEDLSLPLPLTGGGGLEDSYSSEVMWTITFTTWLL